MVYRTGQMRYSQTQLCTSKYCIAYLDILEAKEEREYRDTELSEKLINWRGGDSYNKVNAKNIFGNYLHI